MILKHEVNISSKTICIIGGGISGLTLGLLTRGNVYEQHHYPGGLLASYFVNIISRVKKRGIDRDETWDALFETGGGHWMWGLENNPEVESFLSRYSRFKKYFRKSAVYLTNYNLFVPYPIQYNIRYLPRDIRDKALEELINSRTNKANCVHDVLTYAEFLKCLFGETLYEVFFRPYNEMYTAGLMYKVMPPRELKIPNDLEKIIKGAKESSIEHVGYNYVFYYPTDGWGTLTWRLCNDTKCFLGNKVTEVDVENRILTINDSTKIKCNIIYVTIPLNKFIALINGYKPSFKEPYTSVLVVNVIAKSSKVPDYHWIYLSNTKTGFHRIGYYSNVDNLFLPSSLRGRGYVSAYIEKTINPETRPHNLEKVAEEIIDEAISLNLIGEPLLYDVNFIEVAYTWRLPKSNSVEEVTKFLEKNNIITVGRYASWGKIEGITESIKDAFIKVHKYEK